MKPWQVIAIVLVGFATVCLNIAALIARHAADKPASVAPPNGAPAHIDDDGTIAYAPGFECEDVLRVVAGLQVKPDGSWFRPKPPPDAPKPTENHDQSPVDGRTP